MKINEFQLPEELASDLRSGGRKLTDDEVVRLKELLNHLESPLPKFFNREEIESANQLWKSDSAQYYLGQPTERLVPGAIDPDQTLIIGQAEPDSPIALDYRTSVPRVVYFGDVEHHTHWIELCSDYATLVQLLQAETI